MIPLFSQSELDSATSRQKLPLKCTHCSNTFLKAKNEILNNRGNYCSRKCFYKNINTKENLPCKNCNKSVVADRKRKKKNIFCSNKCAALYNNKNCINLINSRKQKTRRLCLECGKNTTKSSTSGLCRKCSNTKENIIFGEKAIFEFKSTYARHKYQAIRHHAKRIVKLNKLKKECHVCNYKTHVHLAHITGIAEFDKNTKLKEVNKISNLIYLCPNHHWELDHGYLILNGAGKENPTPVLSLEEKRNSTIPYPLN